jgi:hypothetical protein
VIGFRLCFLNEQKRLVFRQAKMSLQFSDDHLRFPAIYFVIGTYDLDQQSRCGQTQSMITSLLIYLV